MPFEPAFAVHPRPPKHPSRSNPSAATSHIPSDVGEGCIDAYTRDPGLCFGCSTHGDPDCLCDVDVSRTAGMVFDKPPPEMFGVADTRDLLNAGAAIWMAYDVIAPNDGEYLTSHGNLYKLTEEELSHLMGLVRSRSSDDAIHEHYPKLHPHELAFLRRAVEVSSPKGLGSHRLRCSESLVLKLHSEGLSIRQMVARIKEEEDVQMHDKTLRRFLIRHGHTPNIAVNTGRWARREVA